MVEHPDSAEKTTPVVTVGTESEFNKLFESEDRVLVDFYADWCGPCQMMEGTVEAVSKTIDATVAKVDIDAHPQIAARFDVSSIPTFIGFDNSAPESRLIGMQDEDSLRQLVA